MCRQGIPRHDCNRTILYIMTKPDWVRRFSREFQPRYCNIEEELPGALAGFKARVGKIRREAPKNFFRLPTLVFRLPTLPYVTVAHPAHRTEADLREKALLATNQEGPLPSRPLHLT